MGTRRALVATAVCVMAVAGCGAGGPVRFGTIKPSGDKVTINADYSGNLAPAAQWPNACDLLTDDEIESVLPQASVDSDPTEVKIIGSGPTESAPKGECAYEIGLPGTTSAHPVQLWLELLAVGDPSVISGRLDHPESTPSTSDERGGAATRKDLHGSLGPQQCFRQRPRSDPEWTEYLFCQQGPVEFSLNAVTGGKADIQAGGGASAKAQALFDKAVVQFPKAIAAKLPRAEVF